MKKPTFSIVAMMVLASAALAADDVVIPDGVRYKKATEEVNERAKQKLLKVFTADAADAEVLRLFENKTLICGPGLWQKIKTDPALAATGEGKVTFRVPVLDDARKPTGKSYELKGQLFQSDVEVLAFWKAFSKYAEFTDLKVRKLTSRELEIYWTMISFDITEPVFVVEGKKHQILVQFTSPENLRVLWIDDFANMSLRDKNGQKK